MSDLISRQAAIDALNRLCPYPGEWSVNGLGLCKDAIANLPSIDAVKHGRWKYISFLTVECSECKAQIHDLEFFNFCPNCGAKMEVEHENNHVHL